MPRRRSNYWTEVEKARKATAQRQREELRLRQEQQRAAEQRRKAEERAAAEKEREQRQTHEQGQRALAARQTALIEQRINQLDNLLKSTLTVRTHIDFEELKRIEDVRPFEPGSLAKAKPKPKWEDFAPILTGFTRIFRGRQYDEAVAEAEERLKEAQAVHELDERVRKQRLAKAKADHERRVDELRKNLTQANAEIDKFQQDFWLRDPDAVVKYFTLVLERSVYPPNFPRHFRVAYQFEAKRLVVEYELPGRNVVPDFTRYDYIKTRDVVESKLRPDQDLKRRYEGVVSQVALRTLRELFAVQASDVVEEAVFNGHVTTKNPGTGKAEYPCILSVGTTRQVFEQFDLAEVRPQACLRHLNALVSPHPCDLDPVRPVVEFDLTKYKFVNEIDAIAGLDGRTDLLKLSPVEFEHLVRQLFEAMELKAWITQSSRDDGVDAVAINEDPIVGGLCVIQAKRYKNVVGIESVRALAGVMEDKRAAKGIMVTTSWFGVESQAYAKRHGRIELINGSNLKDLLKRYCELDVLISIPVRPRRTKSQADHS